MLTVKIEGTNVVIENLGSLSKDMPGILDNALQRVAKGIFRSAFAWLSGAKTPAGAYPVPIVTGHLRRGLDWLNPGESKSTETGAYAAGKHEVVIYDSAIYADPIFEGKSSSAKFGPRNALIDGLNRFNASVGIEKTIEDELQKEIAKRGLE